MTANKMSDVPLNLTMPLFNSMLAGLGYLQKNKLCLLVPFKPQRSLTTDE